MKLFVTVKSQARENWVEKVDPTHYRVLVKEPAKEGRTNEAIIAALAGYFDCATSKFKIISGHHSKNKVITYR